ncbi:alpha/beta hydrolase [Flavobacterium sediminis]|uniref:Alpha/beta hydrolase n=1 Tax=Flavobacterium sediminis TaxID=2201181 RepID=A0A2U8QX61_9FLAO|nr:alpha/beta hydrolase [Flavobacterium sediminis]AWM14800.1 alpha/beta hydrolase [Flavobacterium sediminis]
MSLDLSQIAFKKITNYPDQPTLIFLHDSLGCMELWRDFPEQLARQTHCNVLLYDRQGYGRSCPFSYSKRDVNYLEEEADILADLMEFREIEKAVLFGFSDGGSIALIFAAKYPEKTIGIITQGAHIFVEDVTLKGIQEAVLNYKTTSLKQKLERYHGDKTEALFNAWTKTWTSPEYRTWNIEHFVRQISCKSLIIQGENDEFGSPEQVKKIVTQTEGPSASLIVSEAGHTVHKENPELVLRESVRFIKKIIA